MVSNPVAISLSSLLKYGCILLSTSFRFLSCFNDFFVFFVGFLLKFIGRFKGVMNLWSTLSNRCRLDLGDRYSRCFRRYIFFKGDFLQSLCNGRFFYNGRFRLFYLLRFVCFCLFSEADYKGINFAWNFLYSSSLRLNNSLLISIPVQTSFSLFCTY